MQIYRRPGGEGENSAMHTAVTLVFHKKGLRSYIEVSLCPDCPRQDDKGCCGYYSPVFYPTDLAYIAVNNRPLLDMIAAMPRLTVLDASITVNSEPEGDDSYHCQFHSREKGCLLPMDLRESVCRVFVCPGIGWWNEPSLAAWKKYFDDLNDFEIALNNDIASKLCEEGLSLRNRDNWDQVINRIVSLMDFSLFKDVPAGQELPETERITLIRPLAFGREWQL